MKDIGLTIVLGEQPIPVCSMEWNPDVRILHGGAIQRRLIDPHLAKRDVADISQFDHEAGHAVVVAQQDGHADFRVGKLIGLKHPRQAK